LLIGIIYLTYILQRVYAERCISCDRFRLSVNARTLR